MALILCPICGEQISDKAKICPHCKTKLDSEPLVLCEECGNSYEPRLTACPYCGCPAVHYKKKKHTGIIITGIILSIFLAAIIGLAALYKIGTEYVYYENLENATYTMLDGAAEAETTCNLIRQVWYNAIYEKNDLDTDKYTMVNGKFVEDFNDALSNLLTDSVYTDSRQEIEIYQSEVVSLMKQLQNPPKKYESAYAELKVFYDCYYKITNMALNPTGSLQSFSDTFSQLDDDTLAAYDKMKMYLK